MDALRLAVNKPRWQAEELLRREEEKESAGHLFFIKEVVCLTGLI